MNTDFQLIQKYNVAGPRYTSYPTAPQFNSTDRNGEIMEYYRELRNETESSVAGTSRAFSLYFHIPFCFSLCWYCGCTKIITRDTDRGDQYVEYLKKEMELVMAQIDPSIPVEQVHFGGGTPTFLKPEQLLCLGEAIGSRFQLSPDIEYSVEIDPRRCTAEHIRALKEIGCNRASLGVQDTDPDVQEAIHRIQSFEATAEVTSGLREAGICDINFDLIYGLPCQTAGTFRKTLDDVMKLDPNRLAVYSYAHLPHRMPSQRLIKESELPSPELKLQMLQMAVGMLPQRGMRYIGMDHFAKEDDSLSRAMDEGTLQRNFQGYSTHAETDMIAFGMSGISQLENRYYQNTRDLAEYCNFLDKGQLPVVKEHSLSRDDKIRKDLIMRIMCHKDIFFEKFSEKWGIRFQTYFKEELDRLYPLESDGLLILMPDRLHKTEKGRLFLRNIAMTFDIYLESTGGAEVNRYSRTI